MRLLYDPAIPYLDIYPRERKHVHRKICTWMFFLKILFIFREGKGRRQKGRETSCCGCLSYAPFWGPFGLQVNTQSTEPHQPGRGVPLNAFVGWFLYVPDQGFTHNLGRWGRHSYQLSYPARARTVSRKMEMLCMLIVVVVLTGGHTSRNSLNYAVKVGASWTWIISQ